MAAGRGTGFPPRDLGRVEPAARKDHGRAVVTVPAPLRTVRLWWHELHADAAARVTGGDNPDRGWSCSNTRLARRTRSSRLGRAMICRPIGRPSTNPHGTVAARTARTARRAS